MDNKLHYLLMADHSIMQKRIFSNIRYLDLTIGQPKVLDYLYGHDGAIQKDIADGCYIEPASLSNILNGMEKKGLIARRVNEENRRNTNIFMTEKGRQLCDVIRQEMGKVEDEALSGLSPDEIVLLLTCLKKIKENLEAQHEFQ